MAFSHLLKSVFALLIITGLIFFVYQSPEPAVEFDSSRKSSPIISVKSCASLYQLELIIRTLEQLSGYQMFVAEPAILRQILHRNNENKNHIECDGVWTAASIPVINVGLLDSFPTLEDSVERICAPLSVRGISCSRIESGRIPQLNRSAVTHFIIESSHLQLHVACFIKVLRDVHWVHEMQKIIPGALLGVNQSEVYDMIEVDEVEVVNGLTLPVPANIESFLSQIPTARFINCDQSFDWNVKRGSDPNESNVQDNTRRSMILMKRLMSQLQVPVFLISGSLLGWFRECRAIPYTTDADFATWAKFATPEFEKQMLSIAHANPSFKVFDIFGRFEMGYEVSFLLRNGFKSDLFFLYDERDGRVSSSGHVIPQKLYYKYFYPKFVLCSTIFLTVRFNVPCDPQVILDAEYGDWRTPVHDSDYSYRTSPKNRGPAIKYPPHMDPMYREFP